MQKKQLNKTSQRWVLSYRERRLWKKCMRSAVRHGKIEQPLAKAWYEVAQQIDKTNKING